MKLNHYIFSGERPYKCHVPDCGRAFIQLSNLQQHLRNHESQLERLKNRPFHCAICGKGFATESSMRTHNSKVSWRLFTTVELKVFNFSCEKFKQSFNSSEISEIIWGKYLTIINFVLNNVTMEKMGYFSWKIFHALGLKFKNILDLELRMERQRQTDSRRILREIETETETEKELH